MTETTHEGPVPSGPDGSRGSLTLNEWIAREGRGALARLARDTSIPYDQLWRYSTGRNVPQYATAIRISAALAGVVSVNSLLSARKLAPKAAPKSASRRARSKQNTPNQRTRR